jgi:hypothetical protein
MSANYFAFDLVPAASRPAVPHVLRRRNDKGNIQHIPRFGNNFVAFFL